MFYELNTLDPTGSSSWKRNVESHPNKSFAGDQNLFAQITLILDPDAELVHEIKIEMTTAASVNIAAVGDEEEPEVGDLPNLLPDGQEQRNLLVLDL